VVDYETAKELFFFSGARNRDLGAPLFYKARKVRYEKEDLGRRIPIHSVLHPIHTTSVYDIIAQSETNQRFYLSGLARQVHPHSGMNIFPCRRLGKK